MKYLYTLILLISTYTFGCSCRDVSSVKESFEEFDAVFLGKVISIDSTKYDYSSNPVYAYTFEFIEDFKRELPKNNSKKYYTTIYTPLGNLFGGCGSAFKLNETYLIYGFITDFSIYTNICTRTSELNSVEQSELKELEKLRKEYLKNNILDLPPAPNSIQENFVQKEFELYKLTSEKKKILFN